MRVAEGGEGKFRNIEVETQPPKGVIDIQSEHDSPEVTRKPWKD